MKEMWDERYKVSEYVYGKAPNAFLKEQLDLLNPGRILFPAEGEGRNAVYAASLGWNVSAFDFSKSGYEKAIKLARETGVEISYEIQSFDAYQFGTSKYDACGLIYCHVHDQQRPLLHKKVVESLAPGGHYHS